MFKFLQIICLLLVFPTILCAETVSFSDWTIFSSSDPFSDEISIEALVEGEREYDKNKSVGLRCMDKKLFLTFNAVSYISKSNRLIRVRARVDKYDPTVLVGRVYLNVNESGWIPDSYPAGKPCDQRRHIKKVISEMKRGRYLLFEVSDVGRNNIELIKVSLSGFTRAYTEMNRLCK